MPSGWISGRITESNMVGSIPKTFFFLRMTFWLFTPNFVQFWLYVWLNRISGRISGSSIYFHKYFIMIFRTLTLIFMQIHWILRKFVNRISGQKSRSSRKMKTIYSGIVTKPSDSFKQIAIILFELSSGQTNQQTHEQTNTQTNATENIISLTLSAEVMT